jgi:hypothetical protein
MRWINSNTSPRTDHNTHRIQHKTQYGPKVQLTPEFVNSPTLAPEGEKRIQQVIGALLYYARSVDPALMAAISSLASQ